MVFSSHHRGLMTICHSDGSGRPSRHSATPLLRAIGCVCWAQRLDASIVQRLSGTCPPNVPIPVSGSIARSQLIQRFLEPTGVCPKRYLDRFSRLCSTHTDRHTAERQVLHRHDPHYIRKHIYLGTGNRSAWWQVTFWHCPHMMRSRVYASVVRPSVRLSVCLSRHGLQ